MTTGPIKWNATANDVRNALRDAAAAGTRPLWDVATMTANISVNAPGPGGPYTIEFNNALAGTDVNQLVAGDIVGGGTVTVAITRNGRTDNSIAVGDSGGPGFIDGQIAGIASTLATLGQIPSWNAGPANSSYGTLNVETDVGSFVRSFINPTLNRIHPNAPFAPANPLPAGVVADRYNLVFDMNRQELG